MRLARISRVLLLGCLLLRPLTGQQGIPNEASLLSRLEQDGQDLGAYSRLYRLYLSQGRKADADQVFLRAVNAFPAEAFSGAGPRALAIGDFYLTCGKLDLALEQYRTGMAANPGEKTTYMKRQIETLLRQGKRSEAGELNAQLLRESPDDIDARVTGASLLLDKGDVNGAWAGLAALAVRAPENPVLHFTLGRAHAGRGEADAAVNEFRKAIELRPDYVLARLALAQLQVARGQFEEGGKTAGAILESDNGNTNARLIQSSALLGQKKFAEARQALDDALKNSPGSPDVYFQLGVLSLAEKKYAEADIAFRQVYQLNPANSRGLMGRVETAMAQNQPDAGLGLLQAEVDKAPGRADLQLALGNIALRTAHYELAIASFQKVLAQTEKGSAAEGDAYLRIGETYRRKGDTAMAIEALQKARAVLPNNTVVLNTLAMVLDGAGRKPEAREVYAAALQVNPNDAVAMNNFAFLLAETGEDLDRALTMAERARQLLPSTIVSDTLGWVYLKKGMADRAVEILRDLVDKDPARSTYHYHLAMAYQLKGDAAAALGEARTAANSHPAEAEGKQIQVLIGQLAGGK